MHPPDEVQRDSDRKHGIEHLEALLAELTRQLAAAAELQTAREALAHVTRLMSMGELTASIAHEVNQPLAAIVANGNACLRWLARAEPDLQEAQAAVERIIRDGVRASEVIRRIRTFTARLAPAKQRLDINAVIRESLALAQGALLEDRIVVQLALSASQPVLGDRLQLQQVLLNLVANGIEAMRELDDARELHVRSRDSGPSVFVVVQDRGTGRCDGNFDRMFEAFYTTKPEGMGLGLAIGRKIVEAHGGQLWAEPNGERGLQLLFTLPAEGSAADE